MTIYIKPKKKICYLCGEKIAWYDMIFDNDVDYDVGPRQETKEGIEYRNITRYYHKTCAENNVYESLKK